MSNDRKTTVITEKGQSITGDRVDEMTAGRMIAGVLTVGLSEFLYPNGTAVRTNDGTIYRGKKSE